MRLLTGVMPFGIDGNVPLNGFSDLFIVFVHC